MRNESKHPCDSIYRVVLYQSLEFGYQAIFIQHGEQSSTFGGYVRLSEPLEVRFQALNRDESVREALATLDAAEQAARAELAKRLSEINDQRASLRALVYQPEVA